MNRLKNSINLFQDKKSNLQGPFNQYAYDFQNQEFRHYSWTKFPLLITIMKSIGSNYEHILYLDPETFINPYFKAISIDILLERWNFTYTMTDTKNILGRTSCQQIICGHQNLYESHFIFWNDPSRHGDNSPNVSCSPYIQSFLMRVTPESKNLLLEWWWHKSSVLRKINTQIDLNVNSLSEEAVGISFFISKGR
jgi:hypothetical protein